MRTWWQQPLALACSVLLVAVVASATPSAALANAIRWAPDLETAQAQASREGRLVLVHFWSDDCPPCRALEANVFPRPEVAAAIHSKYVPVKVHAKRRSDLARQYEVDRWPTDVVITPSGQKITSMVSPQDPQQYAATFDQIASRVLPPVPPTQTAGLAPQQSRHPYSNAYTQNDPLAAAAQQGASRYAPSGGNQAPETSVYPPAIDSRYAPAASADAHSRYGQQASAAQAGYGQQTGYGQQPAQEQTSRYNYNPAAPAATAYASEPHASQPQPSPYQPAYANAAAATGAAAGQQVDNPYAHQPAPNAYGAAPEERRQVWQWDQQQQANSPPAASPTAPAYASQMQPQEPRAAQQGGPQHGAPQQQPAAQAAAHQAAAAPKHPPLALDGYCPVALNGESPAWVKGDPRFGAVHRGRTYLFTSAAAQQQFLSDPDRFAPALSGYDPVRFVEQKQVVPGSRAFGWFYKDRYYLFADEAGLRRFEKSPDQYHEVVQQAMRGGPAQQQPAGPRYR